MILVVLGTQELPFTRLLEQVNDLKEKGIIEEDVIVQNGHTPASQFKHLNATPFFSYDEMNELFDEASVIISHGGTGSLITGIKKNKPVIAVARLSEHGEHNDNHQTEIVAQFKETEHIIASNNLEEDIKRAYGGFKPAPYESGQAQIITMIRNYINNI
ncbi:exopolysaccharide biosynthesis protein [Bacillaceae bacterium JMAK1]|nr:exopolysaccharide biosynthesis protein [Bacillaceae bacterium JMAK1]